MANAVARRVSTRAATAVGGAVAAAAATQPTGGLVLLDHKNLWTKYSSSADTRQPQRFLEVRPLTAGGAPAKQAMYGVIERRQWWAPLPDGDTEERAKFALVTRKRRYPIHVAPHGYLVVWGDRRVAPGEVTMGGRQVVVRDVSKERFLFASPTRRYVEDLARQWANFGEMHGRIQARLRGDPAKPTHSRHLASHPDRIQWAMTRYMHRFAHRAPAKPPADRDVTVLYRGIYASPDMERRILETRTLTDPGFMAFSRRSQPAYDHAAERGGYALATGAGGRIFVFKVKVGDVPAGTSWIWFAKGKHARFHGQLSFRSTDFGEVVLPPGTLHVVSTRTDGDATVADATYTPAPLPRNASPAQLKRG